MNSLQEFRQAVAADLYELAILHDRELTQEMLEGLREVSFPDSLSLRLQSELGQQAYELMRRALAFLPKDLTKTTLDELATDYAAIYLNTQYAASPQESTWLNEDGLVRQEPMFEVRKWYQKYELEASDWKIRPDDHLVLELQFLSHLFKLDQQTSTLQEIAQFLDEHLLRWIDLFAQRIARRCGTPFYAGLALVTTTYLDELRDILAEVLTTPRVSREEIEFRLRRKKEEAKVHFKPSTLPDGCN